MTTRNKRQNHGRLLRMAACLLLAVDYFPLPVVNSLDVNVDSGAASDDLVRVVLGFSSASEQASFEDRILNDRSSTASDVVAFQRTNAVALTLSAAELEALQQEGGDNGFAYVEEDLPMITYQNTNDNEVIPYGVAAVLQAESIEDVYDPPIPLPPPLTSMNGNEDCFRVCVIDSGLLASHTDIPFDRTNGDNFRLNGQEFGLPPGQFWYNPNPITSNHGTHVAGTIFARGENNEGVVGVVSNPQGMCLSIARVFSDDFPTASTSFIDMAMEWCADQGSRVINMSLGRTGAPSSSSQGIINGLWEDGILVVAAAGNESNTQKSYPASYDNVLSVAAVDESNGHASFSQRNDAVDISGPGVQVLSTVGGVLNIVESDSVVVSDLYGRLMNFSPFIDPVDDTDIVQDKLEYVDCEQGFDVCENVNGRACLIERGETLFSAKALNCQEGGGIFAMIYNNVGGLFFGSLGDTDSRGVEIPVISLTRTEGLNLRSGSGEIGVALSNSGYSFFSGTSMASPHVAGVAAKIWAARPACTNEQVQDAMLLTARNLGNPGRDNLFGYGLVQAVDAYNYLLELDTPCGLVGASTVEFTDEPSSSPSSSPTVSPSMSPTSSDTCSDLFDPCVSDSDCCSNLCRSAAVGAAPFCRGRPKASKTKVSGGQGGAASGGGGRALRGSKGASSSRQNKSTNMREEIPELFETQVYSKNHTTTGKLM